MRKKRQGAASEVQKFLLSPSEHERFRGTQRWRTDSLLFIELCTDRTRSAPAPSYHSQHCHQELTLLTQLRCQLNRFSEEVKKHCDGSKSTTCKPTAFLARKERIKAVSQAAETLHLQTDLFIVSCLLVSRVNQQKSQIRTVTNSSTCAKCCG